MSQFEEPDKFHIASIQKKRVEIHDLMVPGSGTPWEDAGSIGFFMAFVKTCFMMFVSPIKLLWQIRRPDTTRDANWFVIACGVCWGIGMGLMSIIKLYTYYVKQEQIPQLGLILDRHQYWINTGLEVVAVIAGAWVAAQLINRLYFKLTVLDSASKATPILTYNVLSYSLAPSVFAIIPYGFCVAIPWIFGLWIAIGLKRLKIKPSGAIIASILTAVAVAAICVGAYFAIMGLWLYVLPWNSMEYSPPTLINR